MKKSYSSKIWYGINGHPRHSIIYLLALSAEDTRVDRWENNRSSAAQTKITNEKKVSVIEFYKRQSLSVSAFAEKHCLALKYKKCLSKGNDR